MSEHDVVRPVYHPDVDTEETASILSADAGFGSPHDCSIKHRGRIVNIQEIITLIRSGSSNHDHCEGQRQIEEAVKLLEKGCNVIDEEAETPPVGEPQTEKWSNFLKLTETLRQQIISVQKSAREKPYWLVVCSEEEVLVVIGDTKGLSLNLDKDGIIEFRDLPLEYIIKRSGNVSKIILSQVFGDGPSLEMKAGTYAEYERQIAECGFSDIVAKLTCLTLQAGEPFRISGGKICASYTYFT